MTAASRPPESDPIASAAVIAEAAARGAADSAEASARAAADAVELAARQAADIAEATTRAATDAAFTAVDAAYGTQLSDLQGQLSGKQPLDSDLNAIAALSTTAYGRALLELANAAAGRTALGLGTAATQAVGAFDVAGAAAAAQVASQPVDSDLTAIAALSTTAYGRGLLALADAPAARTALGAASQTDLQAVETRRLDQVPAPNTSVSLASQKITNLLDPTSAQDAATRAYVLSRIDALIAGAPGALDTLNEIAVQLANDESAATALTGLVTTNTSAIAAEATTRGNADTSLVGRAATLEASDVLTTGLQFDPRRYGAIGDERRVSDGAISAGTAILTSATAAFVAGDVGKKVVVCNAGGDGFGGTGVNPVVRTIASRQSATQVTLSGNAIKMVSGVRVYIGTDNSPFFQAAMNAASAAGVASGGMAEVLLPPDSRGTGKYLMCFRGLADITVNYPNRDYCVEFKSNVRILGRGGTFVYPWQGTYNTDDAHQDCFLNRPGAARMRMRSVAVDGGELPGVTQVECPHVFWQPNQCSKASLHDSEIFGMRGKAVLCYEIVGWLSSGNNYHDSTGNFIDTSGNARCSNVRSYRDSVKDHTNIGSGGGAEAFLFTNTDDLRVVEPCVENWGTGVSLLSLAGTMTDVYVVRPRVRAPANASSGGYGVAMLGAFKNIHITEGDLDLSASLATFHGIAESGSASFDQLTIDRNSIKTNLALSSQGVSIGQYAASTGRVVDNDVVNSGLLMGSYFDGEQHGNTGTSVIYRGANVRTADSIAAVTYTVDHTLGRSDVGKSVEMNHATNALVVTVPPNSSDDFAVGATVEVLRFGAGTVTIAPGSGVTIRSRGSLLAIANRYSSVSLRKRATNEWVLIGDLA
jgi:hypothetical protein